MSTTGEIYAASSSSVAEAPWTGNAWATTGNAVGTANSTYATITGTAFDNGEQSTVLKLFYDFSSLIPAGSVIDGVIVRVKNCAETAGAGTIGLVQLLGADGQKVGNNKAATEVAVTTTDTEYTFGGSTDKWGNALKGWWIRDVQFGVAFGMFARANNTAVRVDAISIEVFYSTAASSGKDIGLVVTTPGTPVQQDIDLKRALEDEGHTVTYLDATSSLPDTGYDCLIVTESASSSSAAITSIPSCDLPVMLMETTPNTMLFCTNAAVTTATATMDITTAGNSHDITNGFADPLTFRTASSSAYGILDSEVPSGVTMLAMNTAATARCLLAVAEAGGTLTSGTAPARRAYFAPGIGSGALATWNVDCYDLFFATADWLMTTPGGPTPFEGWGVAIS